MTNLTSPIKAMPSLQRKFEGRALRSLVLTTLVWGGALLAAVPLISVLYMLITRGGARLSLEVFTELPPTGFETGGGFVAAPLSDALARLDREWKGLLGPSAV